MDCGLPVDETSPTMATAIFTAARPFAFQPWSGGCRARLDREFDVAHVAVVVLEAVHDLEKLAMALRVEPGQLVEGRGVSDAGHHVLALRPGEVVAIDDPLATARVTGEADRCPSLRRGRRTPSSGHVAAVPRSSGIEWILRYSTARFVFQDRKTAVIAPSSWCSGSSGSSPGRSCSTMSRNRVVAASRSSAVSSESSDDPLGSQSVSTSWKRCSGTPSTTLPYIWTNRR